MGNLVKTLSDIYGSYMNADPQLIEKSFRSDSLFSESRSFNEEIVPQYSLQKALRPLFGKAGVNAPLIGDHPDFMALKGTSDTEFHPITTFFMDIEGSTRLNLLFKPEEVRRIKNTFICAAIEIINCFDGHVHRIMGDAVMAFFGGKNRSDENSAIDAINCAAVLQYFCEQVVRPALNYDNPFGIRIGIDYGQDVLWSSYGYFGVNEVSATSFNVDVASKLQHQAGRNKIMIGDSLKRFLDYPECLLKTKKSANGEDDMYVKPNLTDKSGKSINYRKYNIDWEKYLIYSIIPQLEDQVLQINSTSFNTLRINTDVYSSSEGHFENKYLPLSLSVPKWRSIKFRVDLPKEIALPYTLKFSVENHGTEARSSSSGDNGNHSTSYDLTYLNTNNNKVHWEHTAFKGLHYMTVELFKDGSIKNKSSVGIYIQ